MKRKAILKLIDAKRAKIASLRAEVEELRLDLFLPRRDRRVKNGGSK